MLAKLKTYSLSGIDALPVEVEVDVSPGALPKTVLVGLPEAAVKESLHRVERAIVNSGFQRPHDRIVINLAPAELPKPPEQGLKIGFTADADKPKGETALVGARIVTMKGDEVIEDGVIVVRDNRIVAVGPRSSVSVPAGARTVDVEGKTIVPGLVDAHWHGAMGEDEVIPQQSWIDYASLALGVTTLHDPSNDTSEIFTHSELQRAGLVVAPRIFSTGTILYGAKAPVTVTVNNLSDATAHLKRLRAGGAFSL